MPETGKKRPLTDFQEEGGAEWIVTYADLVTLLLVFFVMLFSISSLDLERFRDIAAALQKSFGNPSAVIVLVTPDKDKGPDFFASEPVKEDVPLELLEKIKTQLREELRAGMQDEVAMDLRDELRPRIEDDLLEDVRQFVEKTRLGEHIVVLKEKTRITIMVEGQLFFESGQAGINAGALPILDEIAAIIKKYPDYRVNIKGHTDDVPIATPQFPSNWELSAVRATTVLRHLVSLGVNPARMTGTGYGELLPVMPNDTPENRAKNRRVEFVLEKESHR